MVTWPLLYLILQTGPNTVGAVSLLGRIEPMTVGTTMTTETADLIAHVHAHTIPAAFALLPGHLASTPATALLLAIGLQESGFVTRRQAAGGPARGFWQFEQEGGVAGILAHPVTAPIIRPICRLCLYAETPAVCHAAIEHHDVLAACFARLLLYVDPRPLPSADDDAAGWAIYLAQWRPGRPRPETWVSHFKEAWRVTHGL